MSLPTRPALSALIPPIILGGGVYNTQMNADPNALPVRALIQRAFALGINAIDTSSYYGPSEQLIGNALKHSSTPRSAYLLLTKVGRLSGSSFDYTPAWIRHSVARSLQRLHTTYLDVVFCHDVEFVTRAAALRAVRTLFELVDEGVVRYVGISGYPPGVLAELAVAVKTTLGRPLDVVQSYCNFNLQNGSLRGAIATLKGVAGVDVVLNASPLGMGLLSGAPPGDFHPAPAALQEACLAAHKWCGERGESLPRVAMRWVFAKWLQHGPVVSGASYVEELEVNVAAYREMSTAKEGGVGRWMDVRADSAAAEKMQPLWSGVSGLLGEWADWSWESPPAGYVLWTVPGESKL